MTALFNVKGKDLLALHKPADDNSAAQIYKSLGLSGLPFENVRYYAPRHFDDGKVTSYLPTGDAADYLADGLLKKFTYVYTEDRESLEMLFADIDDSTQTMDSIIGKVIDPADADFKDISTWENFLAKVNALATAGNAGSSKEISVLSWRKFKRIVNKAIKTDPMFVNRPAYGKRECRLEDELKNISAGSVSVIDIAKLATDKQAFVFGDVLKTIYKLKLGEYEDTPDPPSKTVLFVDELNKFASKDTAKSSPILRQLLDVAERGRSLGIILFGAEQFRSNIHGRVAGNCATLAFGRTNVLETTTKDYSAMPATFTTAKIYSLGAGSACRSSKASLTKRVAPTVTKCAAFVCVKRTFKSATKTFSRAANCSAKIAVRLTLSAKFIPSTQI